MGLLKQRTGLGASHSSNEDYPILIKPPTIRIFTECINGGSLEMVSQYQQHTQNKRRLFVKSNATLYCFTKQRIR